MTIELGVVPLLDNPHVLYQVQLADGCRAYMRAPRTPHLNEERVVVIVDAHRFDSLWGGSRAYASRIPGPPGPPRSPAVKDMAERAASFRRNHEELARRDGGLAHDQKKFAEAVECFELGLYNPVPLAEVACFRDEVGRVHVNFINGITRTLYLLVTGAKSFPVLCESTDAAKLLHELAGLPGQPPRTVEELAPSHICNLAYVIENGFFDPQTHKLDRFRLVRERWGAEPWWQTDLATSHKRCPYH